MEKSRNFCFSVLALKPKYQDLTKSLARDLEIHAPGITIVVGTDNPNTFKDCRNVYAFHLEKRGILHCYHDKRFVMQSALSQFDTALQIDADTKIIDRIPESIQASEGISAIHIADITTHTEAYAPERLPHFHKLAEKLDIDLNQVKFIGESLFAVSASSDKAEAFINQWSLIARYLELHGIHAGEGNAIGMAAAKVGLSVSRPSWLDSIDQVRRHIDASSTSFNQGTRKSKYWDQLGRRAQYHYRLNIARARALKNFNFYYR
jgi:hypothetical protein